MIKIGVKFQKYLTNQSTLYLYSVGVCALMVTSSECLRFSRLSFSASKYSIAPRFRKTSSRKSIEWCDQESKEVYAAYPKKYAHS